MNQPFLEKPVHFGQACGVLTPWLKNLVVLRLSTGGAGPSCWLYKLYRFGNGPELWDLSQKKVVQGCNSGSGHDWDATGSCDDSTDSG